MARITGNENYSRTRSEDLSRQEKAERSRAKKEASEKEKAEASSESSKEGGAVQGTLGDLEGVPPETIQKAVKAAKAVGSPFVEIRVNGKLLLIPLKLFDAAQNTQAAAKTDLGTPAESGAFASQALMKDAGPMFKSPVQSKGQSAPQNPLQFAMNQAKTYGQTVENQRQADQATSKQEYVKKMKKEQVMQFLMLALIMNGDVVGAMRLHAEMSQRSAMIHSRINLRNILKLGQAKDKLFSMIASNRPPMAPSSDDPDATKDFQNEMSDFQHQSQVLNSALGEMMNNEKMAREDMADAKRRADADIEQTISMAEQDARIRSKVASMN